MGFAIWIVIFNNMGGKTKQKRSFLHVLLLACAFVFAGIYTFSVNSIAQDRFATEILKKKILEQQTENERFTVQLTEAGSIDVIRKLSGDLKLEEAKNISYIHVKSSSPLVRNE